MSATIDDIRQTIARTASLPIRELSAETPLYGSGLVSSLMMLEIMAAVEKEYSIFIRPEELIEDHFGTIGLLHSFVNNKLRS